MDEFKGLQKVALEQHCRFAFELKDWWCKLESGHYLSLRVNTGWE